MNPLLLKNIFWVLFILWTTPGIALLFLESGAGGWWDPVWILLFALAAYSDLVGIKGLGAARICAGIVLLAFVLILAVVALGGWPPVHFTDRAGLRIGGAVPLLLPLLAFALLTVSACATAGVFPHAGRRGLAGWTAAGFAFSVVNGSIFFAKERFFWLWNPRGAESAGLNGALGIAFLGAATFALAFAYPADARMHRARCSGPLVAWFAVNGLFLAANLSAFLARH